jgi:dihydroorotate dehydrogenase (NAD+) catalytic subunit
VPGTCGVWKGRGVILNASGCLDALTASDVARSLDTFVTKTVTPQPREGNPPVRTAETDAGMLNSIGLANPGIDAFLADHMPRLASLDVPIWVSVGGFSAEDYAAQCARLDDRKEVEAIELNLSCPNVDEAAEGAAEIVAATRAATRKPLYAKLSAGVADVAELARAVEAAGADGLSLINTMRGLTLDERTLRPTLATATGGYSGPALKPIALAAVFACYRATELPVVGMGGIASGRDALEFIAAGASAIALGTVLFADPDAPRRIHVELETELAARGLTDPADARGLAHEPDFKPRRTLDRREAGMREKALDIGRK